MDARTNNALTLIAVVTVGLAPAELLSELIQAFPPDFGETPKVTFG